jgi:hypothetical protein
MPLLIAALLALSAALIVLYPLLGLVREPAPASTPAGRAPAADAAERERQARQALREVEFDYTLGNLETGDYQELRQRYEDRALAALKTRYQREQELDALIERRLDVLRQPEANAARPARSPRPSPAPTQQTTAAPVAPKPSHSGRSANSSVRDRRASRRKGS